MKGIFDRACEKIAVTTLLNQEHQQPIVDEINK